MIFHIGEKPIVDIYNQRHAMGEVVYSTRGSLVVFIMSGLLTTEEELAFILPALLLTITPTQINSTQFNSSQLKLTQWFSH